MDPVTNPAPTAAPAPPLAPTPAPAQAPAPDPSLVPGTEMAVPPDVVPGIAAAGTLPQDLSPWGMFLSADVVVQAALIGLLAASVVTWTVGLAKLLDLRAAQRQLAAALTLLGGAATVGEAVGAATLRRKCCGWSRATSTARRPRRPAGLRSKPWPGGSIPSWTSWSRRTRST